MNAIPITQAQPRADRLGAVADSIAPGIVALGAAAGHVMQVTGHLVSRGMSFWDRHPIWGTVLVVGAAGGAWYWARRVRSRYPVLIGAGAGALTGLAMLGRNVASTAESASRTRQILGQFRQREAANPYAANAPQASAYQAPGVYNLSEDQG